MVTETSFTVKFSEIDRMGIVHHSNYPKWFEASRKDYLYKAGLTDPFISSRGFYLPLSELNCKFKSPARYGDEILVTTVITYISCVKVKFEYKVINKRSGKPIALGSTYHAWTDRDIRPVNIEKASPEIFAAFQQLVEIKGDAADNNYGS